MSWSAVRREFITSLRTGQRLRRRRRNLMDYLPLCGSCRSFRAEEFACRHDRPGDARQLVGKRHGNEPRRPAPQEPLGPGSQWIGPFVEPPQARRRSEDEEASQIGIALLVILPAFPVAEPDPAVGRSATAGMYAASARLAAPRSLREQTACPGATRLRRSRGRHTHQTSLA